MPKIVTTSREVLPEGVYDATFLDYEVRESLNGLFHLWKFEVAVGDKKTVLSKATSQSFGPKSVGRKIVETLLGHSIVDGEELNSTDLTGRPCRLLVSIIQRQGSPFNNIDAVIPMPKGPKPSP